MSMDETAAVLPTCAGCSDGPGYHPHASSWYCDDCADFMRLVVLPMPDNDDEPYLGPQGYDRARENWETDHAD